MKCLIVLLSYLTTLIWKACHQSNTLRILGSKLLKPSPSSNLISRQCRSKEKISLRKSKSYSRRKSNLRKGGSSLMKKLLSLTKSKKSWIACSSSKRSMRNWMSNMSKSLNTGNKLLMKNGKDLTRRERRYSLWTQSSKKSGIDLIRRCLSLWIRSRYKKTRCSAT